MDHDARVGQRLALARTASTQQKRAHGSCHPEANSSDITRDELHERAATTNGGGNLLQGQLTEGSLRNFRKSKELEYSSVFVHVY